MVTQEQIMQLVNAPVKELLDIAELSLSPDKFQIFRKVTLNKFGKSGLGKELERVFRNQER